MALATAGCLQTEQQLPFDLDESLVSSQQIGPAGGRLSLASGFSLRIPPGALAQSVQVSANRLITRPFPVTEGSVIPGSAFEIRPEGQSLDTDARLELRVSASNLPPEERVRLGIALETPSGPVLLPGGSYDGTSGILSGEVPSLGAVAAILADDALEVESGEPPDLQGGTFDPAPAPTTGAGLGAEGSANTLTFVSSCSPGERRCFRSGLLKAWISESLRQRLGENLRILAPVVAANMEFTDFDANGLPTRARGSFRLTGTLRAAVGRSVNSYAIDKDVSTGPDGDAEFTAVVAEGNTLRFALARDGELLEAEKEIDYEVRRIGTGALLVVRLEQEITLENDDGSETEGLVFIHLRLRR